MTAIMGAGPFQPPLWALVAVAVPSALIGVWALWDANRAPRCPLASRLCMAVSLAALIQWTAFLGIRASGAWDAAQYERMAAPLRLLVLSPVGGWGIWFTMHYFARRSVRKTNPTTITVSGEATTASGGRLGDG